MIHTEVSDLTIDDGEKIQRLSSLRDPKFDTTEVAQVRNSIFRHFSKNIFADYYLMEGKDQLWFEAN
jgi:hypothetical protein